MISLSKDRLAITPPGVLTNAKCQQLIADIIANPLTHRVTSHYNDSEVKQALQQYHHHKCVYCETDISAGASFRVDHYRPKSFIKEVDKTKHYGYFWLAYEWTNLLQSCEACNGKKSNHFPLFDELSRVEHLINPPDYTVEAYRPITTIPLIEEKRKLLHPELDHVENYLIFNYDGSVSPVASDKKSPEAIIALETIKICDLNRGNLIRRRKKKIDKYYRDLIEILNDYEDRGANIYAEKYLYSDLRKYFKQMLREQDENEEYSRVGFYMFHNFNEFYINRLLAYADIELVEKYYNKLINKN